MTASAHNDDIVVLGLNQSAVSEAAALRRFGNHVAYLGGQWQPKHVRAGARLVDVTVPEGRRVLFDQFRMTEKQIEELSDLLVTSSGAARGELVQLAILWAGIHRPTAAPSRLVISAHHAGGGLFWGDHRSILTLKDVRRLADLFPKAASAVEDLHLSACYSASNILEWPTIFQNLLTVWAYSGSAPGTFSGAEFHLKAWDRATRGTAVQIDRRRSEDSRKGKNVAVWSRAYGLQGAVVESLEEIRARLVGGETIFQSYFEGAEIVTDTEHGPLRDFYNDLQAALVAQTERSPVVAIGSLRTLLLDGLRNLDDRYVPITWV